MVEKDPTNDCEKLEKGLIMPNYEHMSTETHLSNTVLVVEASNYEKLCLWKEWHEKCEWEQVLSGILPTIGYIDNRPIVLSLFWAYINGQCVMFFEPVSQAVDHVVIDKWLANHVPTAKGKELEREWRVDAMNFRPPEKMLDNSNTLS